MAQKKAEEEPVPGKKKENLFLIAVWVILAIGLIFLSKWVLSLVPQSKETFVTTPQDKILSPFEQGLKLHPAPIAEGLRQFLPEHIVDHLESSKNIENALVKINSDIIKDFNQGLLNKLLNLWSQEIQRIGWGKDKKHFSLLSIDQKLVAIADYLIKDVGVIYSSDKIDFKGAKENKQGGTTLLENVEGNDADPTPYLITNLLKKQQGNCATFPVVYAMLARRLGLAHTKLVTVGQHQFCRYDDGKTKINIETTNPEGMGVGTEDFKYIRDFKPNQAMLKNSTTMKSQTFRQEISSILVTKAAYLQKSQTNPELMEETIALSYYFDPNSIYALNNMIDLVKGKKEMPNQEEILNSLTERGYKFGVLLPEPEKVREIENKISEVTGTHRKLFSALLSIEQSKNPLKQKISRIEQVHSNAHATFGIQFNQLKSKQEKNQFQRQQAEQEKLRQKNKFNLQREFRDKIQKVIKASESVSDNITSLLKEDYLLDSSTIQRLRIIEHENRQNYNKVLMLQNL